MLGVGGYSDAHGRQRVVSQLMAAEDFLTFKNMPGAYGSKGSSTTGFRVLGFRV